MKNNKIYTKSVLQHHVYTRLHRTKSNPPISTIITKFRPTADLNRTNKPQIIKSEFAQNTKKKLDIRNLPKEEGEMVVIWGKKLGDLVCGMQIG